MKKGPSDIPLARAILEGLVDAIDDGSVTFGDIKDNLVLVLPMMTRSSPVRCAPRKTKTPTSKKWRAEVRAFGRENPHMTQREIALYFGGVDSGRISEAMNETKQ